MAEIGACPEEMHLVTQKDIDKERGTIAITGVKKHGSKSYTLKKHTATMLNDYLGRHTKEHPFPQAHVMSQMFLQYKKRASEKLCKPDIMKIELRNLRNFAGEQFYKSLPIRDPWAVMHHFRHKKIETTQHYLQAMDCTFEEDDEWISLVTHGVEEECKAIEKGYQLVRSVNETTALYRKRKSLN